MEEPNILFLIIDSFRSDKFFHKEKTSVTPNIDKLIQRGVYFSQTIISDSQGNEIPSVGLDAVVTLGAVGDANGDGEINVLDAVLMVNFALYIVEPSDLEFWASDINQDGSINVLDIVSLVSLILD